MYAKSVHFNFKMDDQTAITGIKSDNLEENGRNNDEAHDLSKYLVYGNDLIKEGRISYSGDTPQRSIIAHTSNLKNMDKFKPEANAVILNPRTTISEDVNKTVTNTNTYTNLNVTNSNKVTNSNMYHSNVTKSPSISKNYRPEALVTNKNKCPQTYNNPRSKRTSINSQKDDPNSFESMFITSDTNVTVTNVGSNNVTNSQTDTNTNCDVTLQIKDDYILKLLLSKPKPMSFKPTEKEKDSSEDDCTKIKDNQCTEKDTNQCLIKESDHKLTDCNTKTNNVTLKDTKTKKCITKDTESTVKDTVLLEKDTQDTDTNELCKSVEEKNMIDDVLRKNTCQESPIKCVDNFSNEKSLESHNVSGVSECKDCDQKLIEDDRNTHCKEHYVKHMSDTFKLPRTMRKKESKVTKQNI